MTDWNYSDYQKNADDVFKAFLATGKKIAVISLAKNGGLITTVGNKAATFEASEEASKVYDLVVASPGDRWYVVLYDTTKTTEPSGRVDETYFGGVQVTEEKVVEKTITKTVNVPVAAKVGLGIVGAFGLLALMSKMK